MLICPNINTPEWIELERAVGRFEAFRDFMQRDGEIRSPQEVLDKLTIEGKMNQEGVRYSKPDPLGKDLPALKKETAESLIEFLEKKFPGLKGAVIDDKSKQWKGKLDGKTPTINLAYAELSDGFHEFAHPFIMALRKTNPSTFDALYKSLTESPEWKEIHQRAITRVERLYPEYVKGNINLFKEEVMATAIGYAAELKSIGSQKSISSKLGRFIEDLFKWLNDFFIEFLSYQRTTNELTPATTFGDVINMFTDTRTQIILDENWDKIVDSSIAADTLAGAISVDYNNVADKLANDIEAAILVNKAFDIDAFIPQWLEKTFKVPGRPYKPRKVKPDQLALNIADQMVTHISNKLYGKGIRLIGREIPKLTASDETLNKLAAALTPLDMNYKFSVYLKGKGKTSISLANIKPAGLSKNEGEAVEEFQILMRDKYPGVKSLPADQLNEEYVKWVTDNYGINWIEATGYQDYGMHSLTTQNSNLEGYTRILFMDDYINNNGHRFAIKGVDSSGNGLGWYVKAKVDGDRFDHEFQSDILPEIHKGYKEGSYNTDIRTVLKDHTGSRDKKIYDLALGKIRTQILATADKFIYQTDLWRAVMGDLYNKAIGQDNDKIQDIEIPEIELPFSKIENWNHASMANDQAFLLSEIEVGIRGIKDSGGDYNYVGQNKAEVKVLNLFLGRKNAEQTEMFEWIKTFKIVPKSTSPEVSTLDPNELPFSKTEETGTDIAIAVNNTHRFYLTEESIRKMPSFLKKIFDTQYGWATSNAPIKPSQIPTELDILTSAGASIAYNLFHGDNLSKNFGRTRTRVKRIRDNFKRNIDKKFNSYKFKSAQLKGFEFRREVYKNPNNILKIAEYFKGQLERYISFYNTIYDDALAIAKTKEGVQEDPNKKRYKKYSDLYDKWFDIVIHQSINSAKDEGYSHYYLPTAKAMNAIEGNNRAEGIYRSAEEAKATIVQESVKEKFSRYISSNTEESAYTVRGWIAFLPLEYQQHISQRSTPNEIAEVLINSPLLEDAYAHINAWAEANPLSKDLAIGPFYAALSRFAKKNNIKLYYEKPNWSKHNLIRVDLSGYNIKPIDRFSRLDPQQFKDSAESLIQRTFGTTYLKKGDISTNQLSNINAALSRLDNGGDVPWKLTLSSKGNYYLSGYKNHAVMMKDYYSPYGPYRTTAKFKDNQPTGSLVELATQEREKYPLDSNTNNTTLAIEQATELSRALSNQLGINYQFVTPAQAKELTANSKNPWQEGDKAFFIGDIVYFVGNNLRPDIVLHEFSHPLIRSIAKTNTKLFNTLYNKLANTPEGQAIVAEVKALYGQDLEFETDLFKEEVLVRGLVKAANLDQSRLKEPVGFAKMIKDLLFALKQLLRQVFGQKIDVSKLSATTTLDQLADMLMKGGNFKIETDLVSEDDTVAYLRDQREYVDDIMKISKPELFALTTRIHDIATKHIDMVQNNKNYEEMINILADEYGAGELQEIKRNLSKYANTLSNRLSEVKDEIEFNKNHATAFVNTLFRLENVTGKIYEHMKDLTTDVDNVNNLHKAFYYDYLIKYWDGVIKEAKEALNEQGIPVNSPMFKLVDGIESTIENSKKLANGMSAAGVKDVLFTELMPIAKTVDDRYNDIISNLKKRNAPQNVIDKWTKEYTGLTETENKRFDELKAAKKAGRLISPELKAEYQRLETQSFEGAKLTPDKLDQALKGTLGDANAFSSFFEGYLYNPDPIVGGFALYVKNQMTEVLSKAQAKFNDFATDMAPLLEAAGYNPANVANLASKITQVQTVGAMEGDKLVERKILSFISPHKDYRLTVDQHRHAIRDAERQYSLTGTKEDQDAMIQAISRLKELERTYFHQQYVPEYYVAQSILERDDLGKKAAYMRDNIFERMRQISQSIETETDTMNMAEKMDELWTEYRQLTSLYDLNGKKKTGEDLAIAERLKEYKDTTRQFYEWKERKGLFQNSLHAYEQELVNAGFPKDSDTFRVMRRQWLERNTKVSIKQEFYERRQLILNRIGEIMDKLPARTKEQVDIAPLYKAMIDIASTYHDEDNQPDAQSMSVDAIKEVKSIEEQLIRLKQNFTGINGLTTAESDQLSYYFARIKAREKLTDEERKHMDYLLYKKETEGLSPLNKKELFTLFNELDEMQRSEATDYYVDIVNNWLQKLDLTGIPELEDVKLLTRATASIILKPSVMNKLKSQNAEFDAWVSENHIINSKRDSKTGARTNQFERLYVWSVIRPNDPADYESTDLINENGEVYQTIERVPSTRYFIRRVKNEYRTKRIVGDTVDNRGNWLPRLDVANSPYINQEYFRLQKEDPKLFAVLKKMSEHHLKNQEGLGYKSRLYLDVPRFRKTALELVQTQGLKKSLKDAVAGRLPLLTILVKRLKLFWQRGKDAQEQGLNPHNDFMLVRADMFDNEVSNIPIAGLYDIDIDDVSTDLTHSMMRYMLSAERQKKLIEINPIARALQNVVNDDKNQVKRLDAVNRFNFINRGVITYLNKKGYNTRRSAVNNFIEREFEGQTNTGMLSDVPWINNTAQLIFKRASFGFFALNIPSAIKNTLGAKFQGMVEASAGKYMNMKTFTQGEGWAFNTMGQISFEIYKKGPKSLNIQITELFDAIQGRFEEKFGESMSRTLASDTANLSWLYNFRKWTEQQATLQTFAGMMYFQKVQQNGKEIPYMEAWEVKDGKIQLKEGIDPEWGVIYDKEGNMKVGAEFKKMKNRFQQVINNLNGAYASFDQPEAQRYLAFRFVSFLRRYFTTMLTNRWGFAGGFGKARGRMNPGLGDMHEGYYVTVLKTLNRMVTTDAKYLAFMTKDEKRAWIKTMTELLSLIAISMLAVPMLGWDDDDPDKYEKLRDRSGAMPFFGLTHEDPDHPFDAFGFLENHMLNLAMQVRAENEAFIPWPNFGLDDYTSMLDLKSLATGPTLKAYKQMFTVGLDQLSGDPSAYYKRSIGSYEWQQEGGSKFMNYTFKALGLTGSSIDPVTAIKNAQGVIARGK